MADAQKEEQILRHKQIAVRCLMYMLGTRHCIAANSAFAPMIAKPYFMVEAPVRNSFMVGNVQMKVHRRQ